MIKLLRTMQKIWKIITELMIGLLAEPMSKMKMNPEMTIPTTTRMMMKITTKNAVYRTIQ